MNVEDILMLTRAGYTKEDITKLAAASKEAAPDKLNNEVPAPTPAPEPTPMPTQPAPEPVKDRTDELLSSIKELGNLIKAGNIRNGGQPPQTETLDDIVSQILNP